MKMNKQLIYAFLPWIAFTSKPGVIIADHAKLRLAVAADCKAVTATDKNF